jgi:hypothetical protein
MKYTTCAMVLIAAKRSSTSRRKEPSAGCRRPAEPLEERRRHLQQQRLGTASP